MYHLTRHIRCPVRGSLGTLLRIVLISVGVQTQTRTWMHKYSYIHNIDTAHTDMHTTHRYDTYTYTQHTCSHTHNTHNNT